MNSLFANDLMDLLSGTNTKFINSLNDVVKSLDESFREILPGTKVIIDEEDRILLCDLEDKVKIHLFRVWHNVSHCVTTIETAPHYRRTKDDKFESIEDTTETSFELSLDSNININNISRVIRSSNCFDRQVNIMRKILKRQETDKCT